MKYYIDELNINTLNLTKLKNNLYYEHNTKNIILSDNGYYTIYNNQYYRYFVDSDKATSEYCYYKLNNYLDKYTMYVDNNEWIRKRIKNIPIHHQNKNNSNPRPLCGHLSYKYRACPPRLQYRPKGRPRQYLEPRHSL